MWLKNSKHKLEIKKNRLQHEVKSLRKTWHQVWVSLCQTHILSVRFIFRQASRIYILSILSGFGTCGKNNILFPQKSPNNLLDSSWNMRHWSIAKHSPWSQTLYVFVPWTSNRAYCNAYGLRVGNEWFPEWNWGTITKIRVNRYGISNVFDNIFARYFLPSDKMYECCQHYCLSQQL